MITKRTLPAVILIFVLAIALLVVSRNSPKQQELVNDALYDAASQCVGKGAPTSAIEKALDDGADPNHVYRVGDNGEFRHTPLSMSAANGSPDAVRLLLKRGADPNLLTTWGTALHSAVEKGNEQIVNLLLAHGAKVNTPGPDANTPLMVAVATGREATVRQLLAARPDLTVRNRANRTALGIALHERNVKIARLLRLAGASE